MFFVLTFCRFVMCLRCGRVGLGMSVTMIRTCLIVVRMVVSVFLMRRVFGLLIVGSISCVL